MRNRNWTDLGIVVLLTLLVAAALMVTAADMLFLRLLALPLVFVLPGYALTAAFFPKGDLGFPETGTFSVGLSLAAVIVGGLILNLMPQGLAIVPWTIFLATVTLGASALAARRRHQHLSPPTLGFPRIGLSGGQVLLMGLSLVVVVGALTIVRSQSLLPSTRFTELWLLPSATGPDAFEVGARNSESSKMEYELEIGAGPDSVYQTFSIVLAPGETWKRIIAIGTPNGNVQARLYRQDDPDKIYREVLSRR